MRTLFMMLLIGCASVPQSKWQEAPQCPAHMTDAEYSSGAVRCRAECASWGRDYHMFMNDCRCVCRSNAPKIYNDKT